MGGRGASSGFSIDKEGKKKYKYGTEYRTVLQVGNVKFIKKNGSGSINTPMETMSRNRVYVTLGQQNAPKSITLL